MDSKIIFVKTAKGEEEMRSKSPRLVGDSKRALLMVDGTATFGEISKRAAPSLRNILDEMFKELEKGGFIQDRAKAGSIPRMVVPPRMATPLKKTTNGDAGEELDFTAAFRAPSAETMAAEAKKAEEAKLKMAAEANMRAEAEAKARQEVAAAKLKTQQEAEAAQHKAEQEAARARAELEAVKAKAEAEARQEVEAAKLKAQQEAEEARVKAEREAAKAREEAERRVREEAEAARVKVEQEAARARAELEEAKAKSEAEAKVRQEIEAAKLKAQQEAEEARVKAEREAAKAREEAERRVREEAEAARVKVEQEAARARAELEAAKAKSEAEAKVRQGIEAAKLKAQQEAEEARVKAEREAAKVREETERRVEAEAARVKVEQEAARVRAELEAAKAKAEAEAKARQEVEAVKLKAQQEAEEVRVRAEREAAKTREEAEIAKQKAADEIRAHEEAEFVRTEAARLEAEQSAAQDKISNEAAKPKAGTATTTRSTSVTVLFFDVVGYTKQPVNKQIEIKKQFNQLVSDCLSAQGDGDRIILDTGDGAAIGFLQHPEDALEVAMQFRKTVMASQHEVYPDLKVRIGIHLGPVNVIKDMNGQSNMVGDGINDAQRVMSFAGVDQIYISRPYHDFVSRLSDEYADLFQYRGLQKDKHDREHSVYELVDTTTPVTEIMLPQAVEQAVAIKLEPFSFAMSDAVVSPAPAATRKETEQQQDDAALMGGIKQPSLSEEAGKLVEAAQATQQQLPPAAPSSPSPTSAPEISPSQATAKSAAEVRMPSSEEVAKLAEIQSKAWAEAERRSIEAAKANEERTVQLRETPHPAEDVPDVRSRRKPVPWGKAGAGLLAVLFAALFAVPFLLPTQKYATGVEQLLAARLQQPVHVGRLAGRLLPTPRLELEDVSIGEAKQIRAQRAQINFALSALFSSNKPIASVELEGVQVNGAALALASAWLQKIAADPQYPIARIGLSQGKLEADGVQLSGIGGELSFNQAGKFAQAKLHAEGGKLALDINATPENKMQVSITARGSALPLLPNWVFDDLSAKGELTEDGLVIADLDSRIFGGVLLGDARIDWRSGWRAQGALTAKTITLQNMNKALNGDMDGTARFQMQSASLSRLTEAATLEGTFIVKKGTINGVDVVETARLRSRENLPGGRTHFDQLSGDLYYANGDYHFRQVKMNAGVLNATGTLDIAKQQISGHISADLTMRAGMGSVALQIGGTTDNLSLRAVR